MPATLQSATESVILAALRSGDVQRAVELLLETFQDEVYGYCTRLVGLAHATRVYERVLSHAIDDLQSRDGDALQGWDVSLRAWIIAVARNAVIHHHRVDRRTYPDALDPEYAPVAGPEAVPVVGVRLQDQVVERALVQLDPAVHELLQLVYWHGLRLAEVSHVTGRPLAQVVEMAAAGLSHVSLCIQQGGSEPS